MKISCTGPSKCVAATPRHMAKWAEPTPWIDCSQSKIDLRQSWTHGLPNYTFNMRFWGVFFVFPHPGQDALLKLFEGNGSAFIEIYCFKSCLQRSSERNLGGYGHGRQQHQLFFCRFLRYRMIQEHRAVLSKQGTRSYSIVLGSSQAGQHGQTKS